MKRQSGIALIQVLLLSGILGLLMLQLGLTARGQLARAQAVADRAEADLYTRSREAALLYTLLTEPWLQRSGAPNPYVAAWNFHGEPFEADGARFAIQDQSGLVRVPVYGAEEFVELLPSLGVDRERALRLGSQLMRLQRGGGDASGQAVLKSYPLQTLEDLRRLPDMDTDLFVRLRPMLTLYPTPGLNPLTAPAGVLGTRLPGSQVEAVLALRAARQLDSLSLWKLTAIEGDESTVLSPGPALAIATTAHRGDVRVHRDVIYVLYPYRADAVGTWQRHAATPAFADDPA